MKIGVFGGAFNPVHNGHLMLAETFFKSLSLDRLIFVPTYKPPHKTDKLFASAEDRVNMLKLAIDDKPYEISLIEFEREEKSYTYDTLCRLKEIYPGSEFYLIIGSDQFLTFDKWYRYKDILNLAKLCTSARENESEKQMMTDFAKNLCGKSDYFLSNEPVLTVSSSEIRDKIKNGGDASSLLPKKVLNYILKKGLYSV